MFTIIYQNDIMVDYIKHSEREAIMNKEELEEKLAKAGIKGEWVNADKYGFR